jgi:hypothetical protein
MSKQCTQHPDDRSTGAQTLKGVVSEARPRAIRFVATDDTLAATLVVIHYALPKIAVIA